MGCFSSVLCLFSSRCLPAGLPPPCCPSFLVGATAPSCLVLPQPMPAAMQGEQMGVWEAMTVGAWVKEPCCYSEASAFEMPDNQHFRSGVQVEHGVWATRTSHCLVAWISAPPCASPPSLTLTAFNSCCLAFRPQCCPPIQQSFLCLFYPFYVSATVPLLACPPKPNITLLTCSAAISLQARASANTCVTAAA